MSARNRWVAALLVSVVVALWCADRYLAGGSTLHLSGLGLSLLGVLVASVAVETPTAR